MDEIILAMLDSIMGSSFVAGTAALRSTVAQYNESAFHFANTINSVAVKPVAAMIVAIILVLELARISTRYDGDQKTGTQVVAAAVLKGCLIVVAIMNVDLILGAINEVGDTIIAGTDEIIVQSPDRGAQGSIYEAIKDASYFDKAALIVVLFFPWLFSVLGGIAVKVMVFIRFAELYILSAAATLPLAFLGHEETKSIAVGYLRRYGGVVLHGVMIIIITNIYVMFQVDSFDLGEVTSDNVLSMLTSDIGQVMVGPLFFLFMMFGSGKLARAMLGDG